MLYVVSMFVDLVPNRNSRPAVLLRESYREGEKVKKRTLANLSDWPTHKVEALKAVLRGAGVATQALAEAFEVVRSLPHGHVAAVVGSVRRVGLETILASHHSRQRDICLAMVAARVIAPLSKLGLVRALRSDTGSSSLAEVLHLGDADEDELLRGDGLAARAPGRASRRPWPNGTWPTGRWCSTT